VGLAALLCSTLVAAPPPAPLPRFQLQSRLVDAQGKPVAGAEVRAVQMAPHCIGEGVMELSRPVTKGRDGSFALSGADFVEGAVLLRVSSGSVSAFTRLKVVR
jgi:hypothetical protein